MTLAWIGEAFLASDAWLAIAGLAAVGGCAVFLAAATFAPRPVRDQYDAFAHARCMYCDRSTLRRYRHLATSRRRWAESRGKSPAALDWGDDRQCPHHRSFHRYLIVAGIGIVTLNAVTGLAFTLPAAT
jgi:hypothetical protein